MKEGNREKFVEYSMKREANDVGVARKEERFRGGTRDGPPTAYVDVYFRRSLNACVQPFCRNPGMHQRMHSGSIARAASAFPRSSASNPN